MDGQGEAVKEGEGVAQPEAVGVCLLVWGSVMVAVGVMVKATEGLAKKLAEADAEAVKEGLLLPVWLPVEVVEEEGLERIVGERVWGEGDEESEVMEEGEGGCVGETSGEGEVEAEMEAVGL